MELTLSSERAILVDTARSLLARRAPLDAVRVLEAEDRGFDRALWRELAGLGWATLHPTAEADGNGFGFLDAALLADEMGRALLPSPFVPTVTMAEWLLASVASEAQRRRWLPRLGEGDLVVAVAIAEPGARSLWDAPSLGLRGGRLVGKKAFVPFARDADLLLVAVADGSLVAVEAGAPGVRHTRQHALGGEPIYEVSFDGVACEPVGTGAAPLAEALDRGAVATLAYLSGACERVLDLSLAHAKTREQFGRPIGSFQAVAHRCVDMRSDIDALRVLVQRAAWRLSGDESAEADVEVGSACAYGLEAIRRVIRHAHQVHGAIGFAMDYDLQLFTRRAKAAELTWGPPALHEERVARAIGLGGCD